jgi:chromosome segregation ATPase
MGKKNNIRSIRFSDELAELIDCQQGDTFTQKFENLVTRCVWELPAKQRQVKQLESLIQEKRERILELSGQVRELESFLNELLPKIAALDGAVDKAVKKWNT